MGIRKEKFSEERMVKIKKYLSIYKEKNSEIDFDIEVDKIKAVRRTSDPELFDTYKTFVDDSTKEIVIRLYIGTSNNCDKIIFSLDPTPEIMAS